MKKLSIILVVILASIQAFSQPQSFGYKDYSFANQANIGGGTKSTNTAAWLEIGPAAGGSTKGLLLPMGDRNQVVSPVTGLMFYDVNDKKVYQFNGSTWELVGGVTGSFINNQNTAAQTGNIWIDGSGRFGGTVTVGSLSSAPTGVNGSIYYNTGTNTFQGYQNGSWKDFATVGSGSFINNQNTAAQTGDFWIQGSATNTGSFYSKHPNGSTASGYYVQDASGNTVTSLYHNPFEGRSYLKTYGDPLYIQVGSNTDRIIVNSTGTTVFGQLALDANIPYSSGSYDFIVRQSTGGGLRTISSTSLGGSFIQNQNTSAQTGNFWINGSGKVGTTLTVGDKLVTGNLATAPTGTNGSIYYNTTTNAFQGYQNGAWKDFVFTSPSGDLFANSIQIASGTELTFKNTSGGVGFKMYSPVSNQFDFSFYSRLNVYAGVITGGAASLMNVSGSQTYDPVINITALSNDNYYYNTYPTAPFGKMNGIAVGISSWVSSGYHDHQPGRPYGGALVFDDQATTDQTKGLFYFDSNGFLQFAANKDGTFLIGSLASAPTTGANGSVFYNKTSNRFQGYQNGSWVDFATSNNASTSTLNVQTTDAGSVGTTETDFGAYTMPGGTLANTGDRIEIDAWFYYAANTNSKQLKFYFGSTYNSTWSSGLVTSSGGPVKVRIVIVRTSATTQKINYQFQPMYGSFTEAFTSASETLANSVLLKFTGTGVADNDITFKISNVTKYSAP